MKILIPLLSRQEFDEGFVENAVKGAKEVILLLVIDTNALTGMVGFAASEIMQGTHLMEEVREAVGKKRKKCSEITEWGDTVTKIKNVAELNSVDKIILMKQENTYWKELEGKLKKECKKKILVLEGKKKEEEKEELGIGKI